MNKEISSFIDRYVKEIKNNSAAMFIGAGFSKSAGYVDWKNLLKDVADDLELDIDKEYDLVSLAQYCYNKNRNRSIINDLIFDEFNKEKGIDENHRIIARLPIFTYWTTNYDSLIEEALEEAQRIVDIKYNNKQLSLTKPHRDAVVYKMHGDKNNPDEAILIKDDYEKYYREHATYYKGETSESPDLTDTSTENIKKNLKDMMYDTSVTIVILSPNMKESKWIDWEIEYCLKDITRKDRTSHTNGVVAVIMKVDNSYEWFKKSGTNCHGSSTVSYELDKVFDIISQNHFNSNPEQWHCDKCKTYDWLNGSYITFVEEETFMDDPEKYINNAYDKSENDASGYDLVKQR